MAKLFSFKAGWFHIVFIMIFFASLLPANAQHIIWQNTIGGNNSDNLYSIAPTTDGGIICGGSSNSNISGNKSDNSMGHFDFWVVKLDSTGQIAWQKTIGGNNEDVLKSVFQTNDGGYLCSGWSYSGISGDKTESSKGVSDYWLVKLDSSAGIQWQRSFGGSNNDYLLSAAQAADGGYFGGGFSISNASGDKSENKRGYDDYWVVKLDNVGNLQWEKTIGGNSEDKLCSIVATADSGCICAGFSGSGISGDKTVPKVGGQSYDFWLIKLGNSGAIQWQKDFGGNSAEWWNTISKTPDGGYICGGSSYSNISGDKTQDNYGFMGDFWVIKLDSVGNIQWDKTLGGDKDDLLTSVIPSGDSGYFCSGYSWSNISGNKSKALYGYCDYWLVFLDTAGSIKWQAVIGGGNMDQLNAVFQDNDGGIVCGGVSNSDISFNKSEDCYGNYDYWVLKFDRNIGAGINEFQVHSRIFRIITNPAREELLINLFKFERDLVIRIMDIFGSVIYSQPLQSQGARINISNFSSGVYFIQAGAQTEKFIKLK